MDIRNPMMNSEQINIMHNNKYGIHSKASGKEYLGNLKNDFNKKQSLLVYNFS